MWYIHRMEPKTITAEQLADFLAVTIDTLKMWRTKRMMDSTFYLPANGPKVGKQATYLFEDVTAFLICNEDYRNTVLAAFAPVEIANRLLPLAYQISQLRGTPATPDGSVPLGLLNPNLHQEEAPQ